MNSRLVALAHNGISKSQNVNRRDDAQNRSRLLFAPAHDRVYFLLSTHAASIIPLVCKSSRIGIGGRNVRGDLAIPSIVGHTDPH